MMLADGNLLIAFKHSTHLNHSAAKRFFSRHAKVATCPITELNLLRGLMILGYSGKDADSLLLDFVSRHRGKFLNDDISATSITGLNQGHRQTTDAYLAKLAEKHGMKIATLDEAFSKRFPEIVQFVG